jgi:Domain of unknown function (DUF1906)
MAAYNGPPDAVDYSFSRANIAQLVAAGIKLVSRYLSHDSGKNLSAAEAKALLAAGIAVLLNWETYADRAAEGYAAGVADGRDAAALARSIGAPLGLVIYFSVDFQPVDKQFGAVADYFRGVRAGLAGQFRIGVYGNDDIVDYLHGQRLVEAEWQTYAWSAGRLSPEADLYQYLNGQRLAGADVDFDKIIHPAELGAWWPAGRTPSTDWFDMADVDDLKNALRAVLNEGTAVGQTNWAGTNRAILSTAQALANRLNEVGGSVVNSGNAIKAAVADVDADVRYVKSAVADPSSGLLVRVAAVQVALDELAAKGGADGTFTLDDIRAAMAGVIDGATIRTPDVSA